MSRVLIGNYLQNYHTLHSVLKADSVKKPVRKLSSDSNVFYFPDGSVWLFQEYQLKEPSFTGYIQTVAVDVSEIYHNSEEIRKNNEKLELLNRKLEEMYEKIGDEIREQETLAMKMKIHDSFGRSLLSIDVYKRQGMHFDQVTVNGVNSNKFLLYRQHPLDACNIWLHKEKGGICYANYYVGCTRCCLLYTSRESKHPYPDVLAELIWLVQSSTAKEQSLSLIHI